MNVKRHPFLWILTASFFLAAVVLFVFFRFVATPPTSADTGPKPMYTIRAWKGQVAVFEGDMPYPKQVYDMAVSGLPPELQQRLEEGVPIYSEMELSVLLEDYTS